LLKWLAAVQPIGKQQVAAVAWNRRIANTTALQALHSEKREAIKAGMSPAAILRDARFARTPKNDGGVR
jgi:hypothetical protein